MTLKQTLISSKLTRILLYTLIFFQPFTFFNGFRTVGLYGLLLVLALRLAVGQEKINFRDWTSGAFAALIAWALVSSIASPYPAESLNAMRKDLLPLVIIFLATTMEFKSFNELKPLLWVAVSSFCVVTGFSFAELVNVGFNWQDFHTLTLTTKSYAAGFANNGGFYLPFIAAWILSAEDSRWKKLLGGLTVALGIILVIAYDSRTALVAIPFAILSSLILNRRLKMLLLVAVAFIVALSLMLTVNPSESVSKRFRSLSNTETFTTNTGLSGRLGIWTGVVQLIKDRPVLGYGCGWKKLSWAVRDSGYPEEWKKTAPDSYYYFITATNLRYGEVNPHNLLLQISFEIGVTGLVIFLWLWGTVIFKLGWLVRKPVSANNKTFALASIGILIAYAMFNVTNGFWGGVYGNMMIFLMAVIWIGYHEEKGKALPASKNSPHIDAT
jgi:O-antigen ligase